MKITKTILTIFTFGFVRMKKIEKKLDEHINNSAIFKEKMLGKVKHTDEKIDKLEKHMDTRFDDLKDTIKLLKRD